MSQEHTPVNAEVVGYIARDFAYSSGITREQYDQLGPTPQRLRFVQQADKALDAMLDWSTRKPELITALRAAGFEVYTHYDGYGDKPEEA